MKVDKYLIDLIGRLDKVENKGEIDKDKDRNGAFSEEDATRYQEMKKQYMLHDENMYLKKTPDKLGHKTIYTGGHCTSEGCVLECAFWPKIGFLSENGNPYYDDVNLMVSFYGLENTLETRRKLEQMTDEEFERYRHNLKLSQELTEESEKTLAEGKTLYSKSGVYPPEADPRKIPGVQYYEWKFKGDIYDVRKEK